VAESAVSQTEAHREQVAALVDAGVAARVDLMRVDAQLATAQVGVARAHGGVAIAENALRTLLHQNGSGNLSLGEDLTQAPDSISGGREALVARALDTRPELQALLRLVQARDDLISARAGARLPHLSLQGNVDVANPNQRVFPQTEEFRTTWDVSAVLSWSPNDFASANTDVSSARAEQAQAEADLESLRDAIRLEVTQAYEQYESARAALVAATAGIEAAEESYRVRHEQLDAGTAVSSDLIDAESELTRARLQLLDAAIDVRLAHARLRRALGEL
jgi:outer membrane protein TolC